MSGPHDLFARYTFGHPERAAAELRVALPPEVVAEVEWETLSREPGSVVDPELRETHSDLLFSARLRTGRPLLLYVLLEHQSRVERWMALRMLRYVVRQLERWRQQHPESEVLPVIIPLVMYHGQEGGWTAPRRVEELFDIPTQGEEAARWRALVPRFEYLLDDLTSERAEALGARPGPPLARLAWLALRFGRSQELTRRLPQWVALFAQVEAAPEGTEHLLALIRYLLAVGDRRVGQATGRVLHSVLGDQRAEDLMKSYADQLVERGERRGLKKGQLKARAEYVLRILAARGLEVDLEARERILTCRDMATLDAWFDKALKATTLSDVLGDSAR